MLYLHQSNIDWNFKAYNWQATSKIYVTFDGFLCVNVLDQIMMINGGTFSAIRTVGQLTNITPEG